MAHLKPAFTIFVLVALFFTPGCRSTKQSPVPEASSTTSVTKTDRNNRTDGEATLAVNTPIRRHDMAAAQRDRPSDIQHPDTIPPDPAPLGAMPASATTTQPRAADHAERSDLPDMIRGSIETARAPRESRDTPSPLPKIYKLNIGDQIELQVFDEPEMTRIVTVLPDGNINYMLAGNVEAVGKTFDELAELVGVKLTKYLHKPVVNVIPITLAGASKRYAIVRGAVSYPGRYEIDSSTRVLDVIAIAQGVRYDPNNLILADLNRSDLYRDGVPAGLNFRNLLERNDFSDNILLRDGDLIDLPPRSVLRAEATGSVSVLGAASTTGEIPIEDGDRVLDVLVRIGGATADADPARPYIYREGSYIGFNYKNILEDRDMTSNITVQDGDFMYFPARIAQTATIVGAVTNSGKYAIGVEDRILDVIAKAGGLLFRPDFSDDTLANLNASYLFRDGRILDVDFQRLLQDGDMDNNIRVLNGDFIYIPEAKSQQVFIFGEIGSPQAIPLTRELTLIEVLAIAGDLTDRGRFVSQAAVFRGGILDENEVLLRDLNKLFKGDLRENIVLEGGDIVYIPEIKISKWGRYTAFISRWLSFILEVNDFPGDYKDGRF